MAIRSDSYAKEDYLMIIYGSTSLGRKVIGHLQRMKIAFIIDQENLTLQERKRTTIANTKSYPILLG